ncbi:MAG TPA: hypothetical protein VMU89_06365 [Thermomicrobiaceae bacterium]|nr:hypothetical protein [Thermomicrobiaceae bacterium]
MTARAPDLPGFEQESRSWRFFDLSYADGVEQAALTEALLTSVARGARPVLRVYSWSEPTVYIGVGERATDVDRHRCEALGVPIVRRLSGGTAVRHDRQWVSVELIARTGAPQVPSDVLGANRAFAVPIAAGLARLGVVTHTVAIEEARARTPDPDLAAACFGSLAPYELVSRGRKLVGLAQVRKLGAAVLHAAIGLRFDVAALATVLADVDHTFEGHLAATVTDLRQETRRSIDAVDLTECVRQAFVEFLSHQLEPEMPTTLELASADRLADQKYRDPAWTFRR